MEQKHLSRYSNRRDRRRVVLDPGLGYTLRQNLRQQQHGLNRTIVDLNRANSIVNLSPVTVPSSYLQSIQYILGVLPTRIMKESDEPCIICLQEWQSGDTAVTLPCFHYYHKHCILNWASLKRECPFCRTPIKL